VFSCAAARGGIGALGDRIQSARVERMAAPQPAQGKPTPP